MPSDSIASRRVSSLHIITCYKKKNEQEKTVFLSSFSSFASPLLADTLDQAQTFRHLRLKLYKFSFCSPYSFIFFFLLLSPSAENMVEQDQIMNSEWNAVKNGKREKGGKKDAQSICTITGSDEICSFIEAFCRAFSYPYSIYSKALIALDKSQTDLFFILKFIHYNTKHLDSWWAHNEWYPNRLVDIEIQSETNTIINANIPGTESNRLTIDLFLFWNSFHSLLLPLLAFFVVFFFYFNFL